MADDIYSHLICGGKLAYMDSPPVGERMHDIRWNLAKQIGVMDGQHTVEKPI